ncbi:MAG: NAD(P)-dependent oxidoreductase, partial [bacterium]
MLTHTRPLWEQLRGKRIFVTGATGFFGIWLLESFAYANKELGLGAELMGLSRDPDAFYLKVPHLAGVSSIVLHQGDVRTFEFPDGSFSHVIHAGTTSSVPVPPLEMLDTITQGTRRTLDFAVSAGAKKFLFVSSGAVYGKQPPDITHIPETYAGAPDPMDLRPVSIYGEGKRVGELLCSIYHQEHGLETTIARCFAFVGPHLPLDAHFAIGNFIRDA